MAGVVCVGCSLSSDCTGDVVDGWCGLCRFEVHTRSTTNDDPRRVTVSQHSQDIKQHSSLSTGLHSHQCLVHGSRLRTPRQFTLTLSRLLVVLSISQSRVKLMNELIYLSVARRKSIARSYVLSWIFWYLDGAILLHHRVDTFIARRRRLSFPSRPSDGPSKISTIPPIMFTGEG